MKDQIEKDSEVTGLYLKTFPNKKSFYLRYRFNGIQRNPKLGDTSFMNWAQARKLAKEFLNKCAAGIDPSAERQQLRIEKTVGGIFEEFISKKDSDWADESKRIFDHDIRHFCGSRKLSTITPAEVRRWHDTFKSKPYAGNRALAVLSAVFSYAEKHELIGQGRNPCKLVEKFKEEKRERFATAEEIRNIGTILRREYERYPWEVAFITTLLFTGSRPSALERIKREEIQYAEFDGNEFGIVQFNGKTGREKLILPPQVVDMIFAIDPSNKGPLLKTTMSKTKKLWKIIKTELGIEDLWLRDFRRTFATIGMSGGTGMALISEVLNHKSNQTTMIYAKLTNDGRLKAVSEIGKNLEEILK